MTDLTAADGNDETHCRRETYSRNDDTLVLSQATRGNGRRTLSGLSDLAPLRDAALGLLSICRGKADL